MNGRKAGFVLDWRTLHLRRYEASRGYVARFTNLTKRPTLPSTQPRC
jgi:hypothetical protein